MTFFKLAFCLALVAISIAAMAADKPADTSSGASATENPLVQSTNPAPSDLTALTNPLIQDRASSDPLGLEKPRRGFSLSDLNGDVCYTMRSYKVKRTERLRDDQSGLRGYSTCQRASNYQVRSTEAKVKDSTDRR